MLPSECTLRDRFIQDGFFCHLAGPVTPTGKAIVHWIGCTNAIKNHLSVAILIQEFSRIVLCYQLWLKTEADEIQKNKNYAGWTKLVN